MPSLQSALDTYLLLDRRPTTSKQYALTLAKLIAALGPDRDVSTVTHEDLLRYLAGLRASGLKPTTVSNYTAIIKAFFAWCVRRRYLPLSPAADLPRRQPRRDLTRRRDIPPDDLQRLVDLARLTSPRNYALLLFLIDTGCRAGGAASLQVDHLDLPAGTALILEKGGHWVNVRYGHETTLALSRWLDCRPPASHAYVWTGKRPHFNPLKPASISAVVAALAARTGASRLWRAHSIRHAVGHAYANAGAPLTLTQRKLNHADPLVTARFYYPDSDDDLRIISERLALAPLRRRRTGT